MSAFKGTPGPWSYCGCTRGGCVCGLVFGGEHAVATTTLDHDEELSSHQPGEAAKRANARLIAAAPELLAELEYVRTTLSLLRTDTARSAKVDHRWEGMDEKFSEWLERIDSAIAKATGGAA